MMSETNTINVCLTADFFAILSEYPAAGQFCTFSFVESYRRLLTVELQEAPHCSGREHSLISCPSPFQ